VRGDTPSVLAGTPSSERVVVNPRLRQRNEG